MIMSRVKINKFLEGPFLPGIIIIRHGRQFWHSSHFPYSRLGGGCMHVHFGEFPHCLSQPTPKRTWGRYFNSWDKGTFRLFCGQFHKIHVWGTDHKYVLGLRNTDSQFIACFSSEMCSWTNICGVFPENRFYGIGRWFLQLLPHLHTSIIHKAF